MLYRSKIHPWAVCGDLTDDILFELYETIVVVIYSSYLSQKPGDSYYPGLVDHEDDHNGLLSKEMLKKNKIELNMIQELLLSNTVDNKLSNKLNKSKSSKIIESSINNNTNNINNDNKEKEIRISTIWNSKEANTPIFRFQVYSQQYCPLGNIIIKEEALHKRSIHWVESIQTKCSPKNPVKKIEVVKKPRKVKSK